jgi:hypothetical protein
MKGVISLFNEKPAAVPSSADHCFQLDALWANRHSPVCLYMVFSL